MRSFTPLRLLASAAASVAVLVVVPGAASADSSPLPVSCDTTSCTVQQGGGYVIQLVQDPSGVEVCEGLAGECDATDSVFVGTGGGTVWLNGTEFLSTQGTTVDGLVGYLEREAACVPATVEQVLNHAPPSCP
jgi:hypothetical protein